MTNTTPEVEEIPKFYSGGKALAKSEVVVTYRDHLTAIATLTTKHQEELEKAKSERFIDGMIAATQWLIDNKHLKAGSELNAMMLQALTSKTDKQEDLTQE